MRVADGPNNRWLSYDTNTGKFLAFAFPKGKGPAGRQTAWALHPDGTVWATGANKGGAATVPDKVEFKLNEFPTPTAFAAGRLWHRGRRRRLGLVRRDEDDQMVRCASIRPPAKRKRSRSPTKGTPICAAWAPRQRRSLGCAMECRQADEGRLKDPAHDDSHSPPTQTGGNYSVVVDKKNNFIWVSEHQVDMIARFDPKTQESVESPLLEAESDPRRLDIDPTNPNRIFFSGNTRAGWASSRCCRSRA